MLESFRNISKSFIDTPVFKTTKKKCKCGSMDLFHMNSYISFCWYECNKCKSNIHIIKK